MRVWFRMLNVTMHVQMRGAVIYWVVCET